MRICAGVSCPRNDGMPPPPLRTWALTAAAVGRTWSRVGPMLPCVPAAASVWQVPHLADLKTAAPGLVAATAGWRYSQSALVYQTAISAANRSPPASGSTRLGKPRRPRMGNLPADAADTAQPT